MSIVLSRLGLLSVCAMLVACQTKSPTGSVGTDFCKVGEPILYSRLDTDGTKKQVREHNAVGTELCKW
jgi:hypothetical protein